MQSVIVDQFQPEAVKWYQPALVNWDFELRGPDASALLSTMQGCCFCGPVEYVQRSVDLQCCSNRVDLEQLHPLTSAVKVNCSKPGVSCNVGCQNGRKSSFKLM